MPDPATTPASKLHTLRSRTLLALAAAAVGVIASGGTIAFREAFAALQALFFDAPLTHVTYDALPPWLLLLVPTLGGLAIGGLTHAFSRTGRVHGVSDVMESSATPGHVMDLRSGALAAAASTIAIGTGGSVGREGPMVHLGATLGGWVARQLQLPADFAQRLLACGVAAGVAASFNAPIAGAIFAAEVVVGHYTLHTFAPIVVASIAGTVISRLWFGDAHEFTVPPMNIESYAEIPSFLALGLACALAAIALIRGIEGVGRACTRASLPTMVRPAAGGLLLGLVACLWPEVLGVGYETTSLALAGQLTIVTACTIALAKLVATSLCLGSGFAGGIFSPSLMIGALLGSAWGGAMGAALPQVASSESVYAMVGMGAVAAATLGAPLSTTLIVMELTGNYPVTLAVMLAAVTCSVVVNEIWGYSFFTWQLKVRGALPSPQPSPATGSEPRGGTGRG